ncbi:MAG: dihydrolipoyl dehydrogenase [Rickettsiales bacterium]|nr:dihydrolipoyl dehydrogenase [Rickettsiales bacterium]
MANEFDVCVLGSGPGGYVAAIKAAQNGLKVACVEKDNVGGVCLNWGCIPTKALLHCAEFANALKECGNFGIAANPGDIDITKMVKHSRDVVAKLTGGVGMLFKKNKVALFKGFGTFNDKNTLEVKSEEGKVEVIKAKYFIIATGASARKFDGYDFDEKSICTYHGAMVPDERPKTVVIVGGGVIGIEFASFYNAIGSKVVVLEGAPDILMTEDADIRKQAKKAYEKRGIEIHTGVKVLSGKKSGKQVEVAYEDGGKQEKIKADKLIMAVGVVPNITGFGLENTGAALDKNVIKTDAFCRTSVKNIFAIGDCTYGPWLAHKASREGIIAADTIANELGKIKTKPVVLNKTNIPGCIYSFPQIASIGLTEDKCKERGLKYKVGTFAAVGNGKSLAANEMENFVKVIFDEKTHELLGAHMIGCNVTEMIHAFSVGKAAELLPEDFDNAIFAHPTVSEMISEAILDAFGKAIHK